MSGNLPETPYQWGKISSQDTYVSIPLPQRERKAPEKAKPELAAFLAGIRFQKWELHPLTSAERQRRKEFLQSIFAALCLNLLIVGILLTIAIDPLELTNDTFLTITPSSEKNEKEEQTSESGSKGSNQANAGTPGSANIIGMSPASITSMALSPVNLQMTSQDINAPSLMFGQSVVRSDFAAVESEERRKAREFAYGNGSHHAGGGRGRGTGVSDAILAGLFPKSKLGHGAGIAVLVDMSGSMQEISHAVESYISRTFPEGVTRHVLGCAIKTYDDPFIRALISETAREKRADYYFICDLQDGIAGEGLGRIQNALLLGKFPKRLHIISFDKPPSTRLAELLELTGGSFIYIDPTLDSEEE